VGCELYASFIFWQAKFLTFFAAGNRCKPCGLTSLTLPLTPRRRALYTFAFACKHFISFMFYKPVRTSFCNPPRLERRASYPLLSNPQPLFPSFLRFIYCQYPNRTDSKQFDQNLNACARKYARFTCRYKISNRWYFFFPNLHR
jgi:hypothetical protein